MLHVESCDWIKEMLLKKNKKQIFTEEKHKLMYSKWSKELDYFHNLSPIIANKHYDDDNNENN